MTAISAHSISTRELSRQSDGKFGTQSHTAQGCELTGTLSTDAVREYLESLGHDPEIVDGLLSPELHPNLPAGRPAPADRSETPAPSTP